MERESFLAKRRLYGRKDYFKHREARLKQKKEAYEINKDGFKDKKKVYNKEYREKNKERLIQKNRSRNAEYKKHMYDSLGRKCCICACSETRVLIGHEIHGNSHRGNRSYQEYQRRPQDFVCICRWCHRAVHWCMKYLDMKWTEIGSRVQLATLLRG